MNFSISRDILYEMTSYANSSPDEIVGAMVGKKQGNSWKCEEFIPLTNISTENKEVHYVPDPNEFMSMLRKTTHVSSSAESDFLGIMHSHPNNRPIPSVTDVQGAGSTGVYIIHSPKFKETRAYYYDGNESNRNWDPIELETN
jgi:proteasome lid subunit RPN8/RPN11